MDLATVAGLVLALIGIVGGLVLEGGSVLQILKPTAALIVLGGTIGATMISFPMDIFMQAMKNFMGLFFPKSLNGEKIIEEIVQLAVKARKEGVVALEGDAKNITEPFFKKAVMMAVDGADPKELKKTLEMQLNYLDEEAARVPKVWESAGGYAPTVGIIGAVMGLIQVMQHLDNIEEVGHGIATAFVATIYGVGFANIIFLPAAGKLTLTHKRNMVVKEMILEGILLIIEGVNPRIIQDKLSIFFGERLTAVKDAQAPAEKAA